MMEWYDRLQSEVRAMRRRREPAECADASDTPVPERLSPSPPDTVEAWRRCCPEPW